MLSQLECRKLYLFFGFFTTVIWAGTAYSQLVLPPAPNAKLGSTAFRHEHTITCLAYSPDGKYLASGGFDFTVRLWDCRSGLQLREFLKVADRKNPFAGARQVNAVAFSPDGKLLAAGVGDHSVHLWETATGKEIFKSTNHQGPVQAVVFGSDGKTLFSAGTDQTIRLWDAGSGKELRQFAHKDQINALAVNKEGHWLVSGAADGMVQVWGLPGGKEVRFFEAHKGAVLALALSPDNKQLATVGADKAFRIWEIAPDQNPQLVPFLWTGVPLLRVPGLLPLIVGLEFLRLNRDPTVLSCQADRVHSMVFSRDGKNVIWAGLDGSIRLADIRGNEAARIIRQHGSAIRTLALSPDGDTLALGDEFACIRFWNWKEGKEHPISGAVAPIESVVFPNAGRQLVTLGKDFQIQTWNLQNVTEKPASFALPRRHISCCLSPIQDIVASGTDQGIVHIWNRHTGQVMRNWKTGQEAISALAFSSDGRTIAVAAENGLITLWGTDTGREIGSVSGQERKLSHLVFSPDGKNLAATSGNELVDIWDLPKRAKCAQLRETSEEIQRMVFAPDSQVLVVGTRTGVVRFWDITTGKCIWHTDPAPGYVMSLCFSPDGRTLAIGSWLTVRLWEVAARRERCRMEGLPGDATALAFARDGQTLAVGNGACTTWVFDLAHIASPEKRDLDARELSTLWTALGRADGARAYVAVWKLTVNPKSAIAFLRDHLRPVPLVPEAQKKRIAGLVAALDQDEFQARISAERDLRKELAGAEPQLREALGGEISSEMRGRIETLLQELDTPERQSSLWQAQRGVEVLEKIGTKEAQAILRQLAAGQPEALVTREAKAALGRLESRGKS